MSERYPWWRWAVVLAGVALLLAIPALVKSWPAEDSSLSARHLLTRIRGSADVAYRGYAESNGELSLPDVSATGRLTALFGETTRMRAWLRSERSWRVDELGATGERDVYSDNAGIWMWNSEEQTATRVKGTPTVRFARPSDLLPPELGRRLALAASGDEIARLPARRVAGLDALGLRITPHDPSTTIARVDIWADPRTGLPMRVELTARDRIEPVLSASFLELDHTAPSVNQVAFEVPRAAHVERLVAPDMARAVDRWSPFVLPETLGGAPRRNHPARAAGTYGKGFGVVAVLAFPERYSPYGELDAVPTVSGPWGRAKEIETPLFNGMLFAREGIAYALGGTVTRQALERSAVQLVRHPVGTRRPTALERTGE